MPAESSIHRFSDGQLIKGSCLRVLKELPENSVDLMITSPPYFMGKDYDRSMSPEDFVKAISDVQALLAPLIKDGGSICWQVGSHVKDNRLIPLDYHVIQICSDYNYLTLRNRIIWTFEHGINSASRFSGRHESLLWFTKGDAYEFDLDAVRVPQKYPGKLSYKGKTKGELTGNPRGKNPGDVWSLPNVKANHVEKTGHPCQFPVALVARMIKATTKKGGLVLDPFAGSASTAIAALETGRRFLCIEREPKYITISKNRIANWYDGTLRIRDDRPPTQPDPNSKVAQRPDHFWTDA